MLRVTFLNDSESYALSLGATAAKIIELLAATSLLTYTGGWQKFEVLVDGQRPYMQVTRTTGIMMTFPEIMRATRANETTDLKKVFPKDDLDRLRRLAIERPIPLVASNRFSRHEAIIRAVRWLIGREVEVDLSSPESIAATCLALEAELDDKGRYEKVFADLTTA